MKVCLLMACLGGVSFSSFAQENNSKDAISKTQKDLKDPVARKKMLDTKAAKDADAAASALAGDKGNLDEMYGISAELIGVIGEQTQGDPKKMQEYLERAQKDPEAFLKSLPPAQQEKIHQLTKKIEKNGVKKVSP